MPCCQHDAPRALATPRTKRPALSQQDSHPIAAGMQAYYQLSYVDRRVTDPEQIICDDAQRLAAELAKTTGDIASAAVDGAFYTVRPWQH